MLWLPVSNKGTGYFAFCRSCGKTSANTESASGDGTEGAGVEVVPAPLARQEFEEMSRQGVLARVGHYGRAVVEYVGSSVQHASDASADFIEHAGDVMSRFSRLRDGLAYVGGVVRDVVELAWNQRVARDEFGREYLAIEGPPGAWRPEI